MGFVRLFFVVFGIGLICAGCAEQARDHSEVNASTIQSTVAASNETPVVETVQHIPATSNQPSRFNNVFLDISLPPRSAPQTEEDLEEDFFRDPQRGYCYYKVTSANG